MSDLDNKYLSHQKKGFTQVPNKILDEMMKGNIPPGAKQIMHVIIRKTWGWQKNEDWIPVSQLVKMTGMHKKSVYRAIKFLLHNRIIIKKREGNKPFYSIQTKYYLWTYENTRGVRGDTNKGVRRDTKGVSEGTHSKETLTKEKKERVIKRNHSDSIRIGELTKGLVDDLRDEECR